MEFKINNDLLNIFSSQNVDKDTTLVPKKDEVVKENAYAQNVQTDSQDEGSVLELSAEDINSLVQQKQQNSALSNILSLQSQNAQTEIKELEEEKAKKEEEYQKLAEKITEKQEEYQVLQQELENNKYNFDINKMTEAQNMYQEIQNMSDNLSSIKKSIDELGTKIEQKKLQKNILTQTSNAVKQNNSVITAKLQEVVTTKEAQQVQQTQEVNKSLASNSVKETSPTVAAAQTVATKKVELKTFDEYVEMTKEKIDNVIQQFNGSYIEANQYLDNNIIDFIDCDGDGKISYIDQFIFAEVKKNYSKIGNFNSGYGEKGLLEHKGALANMYDAIRNSAQNTLLSLDDVENFYTLAAQSEIAPSRYFISPSDIIKHINITDIVKCENWEERLQSIDDEGFHTSLNKNLYYNIKTMHKAAEFIQNNPDKAQYYDVAQRYQEMINVYNSWDTLEADLSKGEYLDSHLGLSKYTARDFNGDGIIDIKDIDAISTEVDLDGDGIISKTERDYLTQLKIKIRLGLYRNQSAKFILDSANIDDLITTVELYDINTHTNDQAAQLVKLHEELVNAIMEEHNETFPDNLLNYEDVLNMSTDWPHYVGAAMEAFTGAYGIGFSILGYLDGTSIGFDSLRDVKTWGDLIEAIQKIAEASKPTNTYLHYVQSADLTKSELEEILSKINAASNKAQSQLTEIKAVVEQRLTNKNYKAE